MVSYMRDSFERFFSGVYEIIYNLVYTAIGYGSFDLSLSDKILLGSFSVCVGLIILVYSFKFLWRLFRL